MEARERAAALSPSLCHTPHLVFEHMDLGPIIRVIENVPARLPVEREPAPARPPAEPTPREQPAPVP